MHKGNAIFSCKVYGVKCRGGELLGMYAENWTGGGRDSSTRSSSHTRGSDGT